MTAKKSILLVHPPVSKPCEPPPGIARLSGALKTAGIDCRVYDANLAGLLDLLRNPFDAKDIWTKRACRNLEYNLGALRSPALYASMDRYKRAVMDTNRVVQAAGRKTKADLSLSNFTISGCSPVRSGDLIRAAEAFEKNPFYFSFSRGLFDCFSEKEPDIIGFSVNFMSQAVCAFAMAGFIRKTFPKVRVVFGGGLITSWMHIPGFVNPFSGLIDDLVNGPGEEFLLEICGAETRIASTGLPYDFASLPVHRYLSPGTVMPLAASRGCYWQKCAFCPEKSEKSGYHPESFETIRQQMANADRVFQPSLIHFLDNALSPKFLNQLIARPPTAPWYGFARITTHLADPDFAAALKSSGCVLLKLGVESGDQRVLDALEKGIDLPSVSKALRNLKSAGIATYVYLLFGTPPETRMSAEKTLAFAQTHAAAIDFLNLAVFNLPAFSADAAGLETSEFYPGDLSLYREFLHPQGWNRDQVRRFLEKEFKKPALIRAILHRDPPFFTSNHAPFLVMGQNR